MAEAAARKVKSELKQSVNNVLFQFDGEVGKLQAFLDALEVLEAETEAVNQQYAVSLIKTKLCGDARLAITNEKTITEIRDKLQTTVKAESKDVAEAKLQNFKQMGKAPQAYKN